MRHPSKLALYLWHSDIGSLVSGVFVASVKLGRRPADEAFESAARTTKNATPTPVMTATSYVRVNTKEGVRRDRGRA